MQFLNTLFFFGLFALAVPLLIHLFNFRRYKVAYFSNVKLIKNILIKTKRESQLMHLLILLCRLIGITALVFAFAQPYIPINNKNSGNQTVVIFVDNSYSMGLDTKDNTLLYDAVNIAKTVASSYNYSTNFVLITNDFAPDESHFLNREEIISQLDNLSLSPNSRSWNEIFNFKNKIVALSKNKDVTSYYISDFQKSQFNFNQFEKDSVEKTFLIPLSNSEINNIAIDTCWFSSPVLTLGQQAVLTARVHNWGNQNIEKVPVRLYINSQQRVLATIDIKANSYSDCNLAYTVNSFGPQKGMLQIDDSPIIFDDRLFFTYNVFEYSNIISIEDNSKKNKYLVSLFGKDSLFNFQVMDINGINYAKFKQADLIIVDAISKLSSGLAKELSYYVKDGGNLLFFPSENCSSSDFCSFFNSIGVGGYSQINNTVLKSEKINFESIYYKGIENKSGIDKIDMPTINKYFGINKLFPSSSEVIMSLENGDPLLITCPIEKGHLFLSAVALDDNFGQAHKHALFIVPVFNIAILHQIQNKLYQTIDEPIIVTVNNSNVKEKGIYQVKLENSNFEFIPEQINRLQGTILHTHDQINEDGFYDITKDNSVVDVFAVNKSRKESALQYYSSNELYSVTNTESSNINILEANQHNINHQIKMLQNGKPLWRWFLLLSLLSFLSEILILRFWKSNANRQ